MPDLYIHKVVTLNGEGEDLATGRNRLPSTIARRAARRMTHLGTLVARVLDPQSLDLNTSLIYGSTYAETRTLEGYVDSFPSPSPLLFQSSIHPSAIQQVFVATKTPVGEFIPLCGNRSLVASMFKTAFCARTDRILVVGGEERGDWMGKLGLASAGSWAWSLELSKMPEGATGMIALDSEMPSPAMGQFDHGRFFQGLSDRRKLVIPGPGGGSIMISWT